jgi:hypothetical protein
MWQKENNMALPLNTSPVYTLEIPSTGKKVQYRPFLVKDEKALLIAQQSEDMRVMLNTLKDVIKSCVQTELSVDDLAIFDIEYIFTQIRAKSVGEFVELIMICDENHGEDDEKAKVKVSIDLSKLKVIKPKEHTNKILLFGNVGVVMKYPSLDIIEALESTDSTSVDSIFGIVGDSIDYIFNDDEIWYANDLTKDEISEFINNLTSEQFVKVQEFFSTMPKLSQDIQYKCPVCNKEHKRTLEGLQNFF